MSANSKACDDILAIQVSDPHLFATPEQQLRGVNTDASLRQVLERVGLESEADLLLLTGDLVQDETAAGYQRLKQYVDELSLPCFAIPGNHDDPELLTRILTGARSQVGGHTTIGNWCIIFLSSFLAGSAEGTLSAQELTRLESVLNHGTEKHIVIVLHHHPIDMGSAWLDSVGLQNRDDFWRIVDAHSNVKCVLWGHVHQDLQESRNNVLLLSTPSTCAQFKPLADDFEIDQKPPAYRQLILKPNGEISTDVVWLEK